MFRKVNVNVVCSQDEQESVLKWVEKMKLEREK